MGVNPLGRGPSRLGITPRTRTGGAEQMARIVKAHILGEDVDGVDAAGRSTQAAGKPILNPTRKPKARQRWPPRRDCS